MICTVGASTITNIKKDEVLKELYEKEKYEEIARNFLNQPGSPQNIQLLGAEINSVASIVELGYIDETKNIYFLHSETPDGRTMAIILKHYFTNSSSFKFKNIQAIEIKGLTDTNKEDFKRKGLKNLVITMSQISRNHYATTIINATGGYKAQIAFALALGQGMQIPVYYRYEKFPSVIELPPLPLTLDFQLYLNHRKIFDIIQDTEETSDFTLLNDVESIYNSLEEKVKLLFEIEKMENKKYITINAMGLTFVESAKTYYKMQKKDITLKPRQNKDIHFLSSESEKNSLELVKKYRIQEILNKVPYIQAARVRKYSKIEINAGVVVDTLDKDLKVSIAKPEGIIRFLIETTAVTPEELEKAKNELQQYLENKLL
mgnify:CR=1 FL=1